MKICIDARWIFPEISGIGLYTQELIRALSLLDRTNDYVILFQHGDLMERTAEVTGFNTAPNFHMRVVRYGVFSPQNQFLLPRLLRELHSDVYHSTNYMMPLPSCAPVRRVVTIHDLIPLLFPDHAPRALKSRLFPVYKRLMREIGRRADLIIAVSESTRSDVIRALGIPRNRQKNVVAIPEGVTPGFHALKNKAPRSEKVILYVGRRDPYKNLVRLIEALHRLRGKGLAVRLRVIGPDDPRYPEAPQRAARLGLESAIDWAGYVTAEQLVREYQEANVYVMPSRYEGFGLTVLEAMACGTPVICSNTSSLPEVAGDAALLVEPDKPEPLANALTRVLTDENLAAELREKGKRRAAMYTWENTAGLTIRAYEQSMFTS